jgi:zinc finger BED domain-containing protein 5/7/8/9
MVIFKVNPNVKWTHCFLHRETLAAKSMVPNLKKFLDAAVQTVNIIKSSEKNFRLFSALCEEMDAEHTSLLFHTEVRWLSRGIFQFAEIKKSKFIQILC